MNIKNKTYILISIMLVAFLSLSLKAQIPPTNKVIITKILPIYVEKDNINLKTRPIRVGFFEDPPTMFTTDNGYLEGFFPEILDAIAEEQNWKIDYIPGTKEECIENLHNDNIDLLLNITDSPIYHKDFNLSEEAVITTWDIAYSRDDISIQSLLDFKNRTIAVVNSGKLISNKSEIKRSLENLNIPCTFIEVQSYQQVMLLIDNKQVDIGLVNRMFASKYKNDYDVSATPIILNPKTLHFAVKQNSDVAYRILEQIDNTLKDLKKDSNSIYHQILEKYIGGASEERNNNQQTSVKSKSTIIKGLKTDNKLLTQQEVEWLMEHPIIRVLCSPNEPPIEFIDNKGKSQGISIEYIKAIEDIISVKFQIYNGTTPSYIQMKEQKYDVYPSLSPTVARLKNLNFSKPYLSSKIVIFGRSDMPHISKMESLEKLKIGVPNNQSTAEIILRDYPNLNIIRTSNVKEAFSLLNNKTIDIIVCNILMGNYCLSQNRLHNIKIIGETPYNLKFCMATRNDWPLLSSILQKSLDQLTELERSSIYRKWMLVEYEHGFNYSLFWKIILVTLIIIFIIAIWNRVLVSEIKKRKRIEKELFRSEAELRLNYTKLEDLEILRDNLMHMVIHDMRSPITVIDGALYILEKSISPSAMNEETKQYINMARTSSEALAAMAQGLLDINRFENNKMPINTEETNLKDLAEKALNDIQIRGTEKNIQFHFDGENAFSTMDKDIIYRVFTNLIGNAIKASPKDSKITIRTMDAETSVIGEVSDTGKGIPKDQQKRIFDKFASAQNEKTRAKSSIGLGLTFCKLAVEAHEGEISVTSRENVGSTFRFEIPKKTD